MSLLQDTTDSIWYPTNGMKNKISFALNPENISDDPYYKLILSSNFYKKRSVNQNFFFLSNKIGLAESLSGNLNTINVFGLGGMNFKGFDYRGIGPFDGNIYLGGNKYFTSTIGYGGSFLFEAFLSKAGRSRMHTGLHTVHSYIKRPRLCRISGSS